MVSESYVKFGHVRDVPPHAITLGDEDGKSQFAPGKPLDEPKSPVATKMFTPCDTALAKIESYC